MKLGLWKGNTFITMRISKELKAETSSGVELPEPVGRFQASEDFVQMQPITPLL